jgi:hypothetical protein
VEEATGRGWVVRGARGKGVGIGSGARAHMCAKSSASIVTHGKSRGRADFPRAPDFLFPRIRDGATERVRREGEGESESETRVRREGDERETRGRRERERERERETTTTTTTTTGERYERRGQRDRGMRGRGVGEGRPLFGTARARPTNQLIRLRALVLRRGARAIPWTRRTSESRGREEGAAAR